MDDERELEFIHDIIEDESWTKFLNEDIENRFVDIIFTMDDESQQIYSCHMDTFKGRLDYVIDCVCTHHKQNFRKIEVIRIRKRREAWSENE
jgi:hypothetical protein